ncbi:hypothetical protein VOLCADRAFT_90494 [Volvox carteri f. nagariensis]|nr:uncharacterized protein VOLCADRAFT_90494 [Volvox carteri f. nagariensis]EFJ48718.1 hypothetical protein VOLCADRAFT_90494 [Volvox carteri f. nagariensis]|eukprot:XP_002950050.1 hypothetical protein VOLCADRAFT_90494 [Volvox carteri f. nagariensis]
MQQYFNNNRHQAVSPTAEVKVDTDRLYDCGEDRFRRAVRDVKDRMGTNPLQEVQTFGGRGNGRSRGGYGAQRFHPYQGGGANTNFSGQQPFGGQQHFGGQQQYHQPLPMGPMMPASRGRGRGPM